MEIELSRRQCKSFPTFIKQAWPVLHSMDQLRWGWSMDAICDHLVAITNGDIMHLLCNVPPGMMKSLMFNVFWPAWEWGPIGMQHLSYIGASHNLKLATRDNMKLRRLIKSEWYQSRWNVKLLDDQDAKTNFSNDKMGFCEVMAFTAMTGSRGHRIRVDDPHTVKTAESDAQREEVLMNFDESLPSRKVNAQSSIAIVMQRLHEADVSGHILTQGYDYVHLVLPMEFEPERRCFSAVTPVYSRKTQPVQAQYARATQEWVIVGDEVPKNVDVDGEPIQNVYPFDPRTKNGELLFPERFDAKEVDRLKKSLKEYGIAGQLQQRPAPRGGGAFKKDNWLYLDECPDLIMCVRGWDLAATSARTKGQKNRTARSAGVKMGLDRLGRVIIVHIAKGHWTPGQVETKMRSIAEVDGYSVHQDFPQDPGQAGKSQKRAFAANLHGFQIHSSTESGSKSSRALPLQAQQEAGNVFLVRGPWNHAFVAEASSFPAGVQRDQIDASSRAYARLLSLKQNISSDSAGTPIIIEG